MRSKSIVAFLISWLTFSSALFPQETEQRLWHDLRATTGDSLRVERLFSLVRLYTEVLDDPGRADSLGSVAVGLAESSHRTGLRLLAYNLFAESADLHRSGQVARGYLGKALDLLATEGPSEFTFRTSRNMAAVYRSVYDYDRALELDYRALSVAGLAGNSEQLFRAYLAIGADYDGKNRKIEAFRNYLTASAMAEKSGRAEMLTASYSQLSAFYGKCRMFTRANRYKLMQQEILRKKKPVDSTALFWTEYDLLVIDADQDSGPLNDLSMMRVLDFARRTGNQRMVDFGIALYRTHLVETNRIGQLKDLYLNHFPDEWKKLVSSNPALFYRLSAFFCESVQQPDSARYYLGKAESILSSDPNLILQSKFYYRYGQFLLRQNDARGALEKFRRSYEQAERASYFEYMTLAAGELELLSSETSDYKNAYRYAHLVRALDDSLDNAARRDQILSLEIDHEARQREWFAGQEQERTLRRHNLQYTGMTVGILTVFVILIMLGSLKVSAWIIRTLGFFSFIFLFEFITLLADQQIHGITHGEPWKILLIKIFLIAILLPLHHAIEKKVITYLLNHKLLNINKTGALRNLFRNRKPAGVPAGNESREQTGEKKTD